ncbi:MAG: Nitrilase/cyanide hydratase and apolipoprotein N-acyltransferase [Pseudonocardiales bacterium]|nr:Nitrilase/cyanide hydratase and apolipoprotein N-acyltransferase [Pseudonocardiales bacterium]
MLTAEAPPPGRADWNGVSCGTLAKVRIAAYQSSLATGPGDAIGRIRDQLQRCADESVDVLCCPEAVLGGLADYAADPARDAIRTDCIETALAPLASDAVTTIVGLTELGAGGSLYNSAAVLHRGRVVGVHRKLHPAINRSVYTAGTQLRVFRIPCAVFGIVICNDSNFARPARRLRALGATVLFVPTNNALPPGRFDPGAVAGQARAVDVELARSNRLWVVRADVSGEWDGCRSAGSSGVTDPSGTVVQSAQGLGDCLLIHDIPVPES